MIFQRTFQDSKDIRKITGKGSNSTTENSGFLWGAGEQHVLSRGHLGCDSGSPAPSPLPPQSIHKTRGDRDDGRDFPFA